MLPGQIASQCATSTQTTGMRRRRSPNRLHLWPFHGRPAHDMLIIMRSSEERWF